MSIYNEQKRLHEQVTAAEEAGAANDGSATVTAN